MDWGCARLGSLRFRLAVSSKVLLRGHIRPTGDGGNTSKALRSPGSRLAWSSAVFREEMMAVASVTKITAASSEGFDAAVREGLARANKTVRGITGLHVIEHKASVENGKIEEYRVTMEVTFILED
jgi:dodecin